MKKKELMKRLSAIAMAALMTITMIPSNVFAADIEFSDGGQDAIEVQADTDEEADAELSVQNEESDDAENLTIGDASQDEISDTEVFSVEEDENASDSDDIAAFSDAESDTDSDAEAKAAAKKWLEENYISGSKKLISNGAKSADGLSYTMDLKSSRGSNITSIAFSRFTGGKYFPYISGWYIDSSCEWLKIDKTPSKTGSISIVNRPTAAQGDQSFKAKLRVFADGTSADTINDEKAAAEAALAEQEFTITIKAAEPNYTMTVKVVDADDNSDLTTDGKTTVKLEKNWTAVSPETDGSYKMEKGAEYTLTVTRDGYIDYKDSYFTFDPTEENTVRTVQLQKKL